MTINEAELRKLAEQATRGPWTFTPMGETTDPEIGAANGSRVAALVAADMTKQNARFIAAANPAAVIALLDKIATLSACLLEREQSLITAKRELDASYAATPAQPIAPAADVSALTDLSKQLRDIAAPIGNGDYVQVRPQMLNAAAQEMERYYGGMMAWKQTAETKDRQYCEEVTRAVNARIAAHAAVSAQTDERAAFEAVETASLRKEAGYDMSEAELACHFRRNQGHLEHGCYTNRFRECRWEGWQAARAAAPVSGPTRTKLWQNENEEGQIGWYFDCDGHYIDVERDEQGKISIFFRDRSDGKEGWLDQADEAAPVSGQGDAPDIAQSEVIAKTIVGLRDGWATRKDADEALAMLKCFPWSFYPAAPVSGQGASIGDDPKFIALLDWALDAYKLGAKVDASRFDTGIKELCAYIDSRPRSEDSRAKVLAYDEAVLRDAVWEGLKGMYGCSRVWSAWQVGTMTQSDFYLAEDSDECIDQVMDHIKQALASTPPKADNE